MPDLPKSVQERLYFLRFEDLMKQPTKCLSHVTAWLGLAPFEIDPNQLTIGVRESDSHYHMKYLHVQSARISQPQKHLIPPRIQARIEETYTWYYQMYYPPQKPAERENVR